jgi:hypothetical protein
MRTWSLPLPVQPCAIVSQPLLRAYSTASLAISGRPERREQRVAVAVVGVRLDRREHVLARELLARVDDVAVERAELERLAADDVVVLPRLPEVHGQRDHLGLVLVLDPLEHHARVQAARVEQQHAPDLAGLGQVGRHARRLGIGDAVDLGMCRGIARLGHRRAAYEDG